MATLLLFPSLCDDDNDNDDGDDDGGDDDDKDKEDDEEESPTLVPVPAKRGRPKGSKDAHPRTRTKPVHTPSKQYTHDDTEHHNSLATSTAPSATAELRREAPSLLHLEEAMANARQQEVDRRQNMYTSWLPY